MADRRAHVQKLLRILVVDDKPFQRRLTTETLRQMRTVQVEHAESVDHCLAMLPVMQPHVVVAAWDVDGCDGVDLAKRIRAGEAGDSCRRVPIVIATERCRVTDIARARSAGVNEFVQVPFSTTTLLRRVRETQRKGRDFVESAKYVGPCRRRGARGEEYEGPRRRLFDSNDKNADSPEIQIRKGLARMYCERIGVQLRAWKPGDVDGLRDLGLTCGQLSALAGDMKDRLLMSAASSLFNYIKGVGADAPLNVEVVQAHLDSMVQLAELPNHQVELRQTVTQQLTVMVTKKLRQAGQAA